MLRPRISKRDLMERLYTTTHLHSCLNTNLQPPLDPSLLHVTKLGEKVYLKVNTGIYFCGTGHILGETAYLKVKGGILETAGRVYGIFSLRKLCNDDHDVKLDAQNPSPAAFATRSAASWRPRDEAMPRCRAPDEARTIYAE